MHKITYATAFLTFYFLLASNAFALTLAYQTPYLFKCERKFSSDTPKAIKAKELSGRFYCRFEYVKVIYGGGIGTEFGYAEVEVPAGKTSASIFIESIPELWLLTVLPATTPNESPPSPCEIVKSTLLENRSDKFQNGTFKLERSWTSSRTLSCK